MAEEEKSEETFKVDTGDDKTIELVEDSDTSEETFKVDTEKDDDKIVLDTSTGKGMENVEIPNSMKAPIFEGGKKVKIIMNEQYGFPHGIQITAAIANHKPQLVGKPSDVERHSIPDNDIVIEIGGEIVFKASEDGFPDTQRGPEWVTEILSKTIETDFTEDEEQEEEKVEPEILN